jgi:LmbE family N-acetylglucosaminyl deacetylase
VVAFEPTLDDIELVTGGTLAKLADQGYRTGVVDMVRENSGTRVVPGFVPRRLKLRPKFWACGVETT